MDFNLVSREDDKEWTDETEVKLTVGNLKKLILENPKNNKEIGNIIQKLTFTPSFVVNTYQPINNTINQPISYYMTEYGFLMNAEYQILEHQKKALEFIEICEQKGKMEMYGSLLSLEMGLGKTLIALCSILRTWMKYETKAPSLFICNKSLIATIMFDANKFFGPHLRLLLLNKELNPSCWNTNFNDYHVILMTYDSLTITNPDKRIFDTTFLKIVTDESHRFSNVKTKLFEALSRLKRSFRLCLTGTPFKNYHDDLFAQLLFLGLSHYKDINFNLPKNRTIQNYTQCKLGENILCMNKIEAGIVLPPMETIDILVDFNQYDQILYDYIQNLCKSTLAEFEDKKVSFVNILSLFTRLRQVCISSYLLCADSKKNGTGFDVGDFNGYVGNKNYGKISSKLQAIVQIIAKIPENEKIIIFSEWSSAIDLLHEILVEKFPTKKHLTMDGQSKNRDSIITEAKLNPQVRTLAMTNVGSVGLNLTEFNHVIFMEKHWNVVSENQGSARVHRIGQKNNCYVYKLMMRNSIEENMKKICENKEKLKDQLLGDSASAELISSLFR